MNKNEHLAKGLLLLIALCLLLAMSFQSNAQCPTGQVPVDIQITADANAGADNTRWELLNTNGGIIASGTQSEIVCVSASLCMLFKIYDDFGNGYFGIPPGSYSIYYDGSLVDADINFGTEKTLDLGNCSAGSSCSFPITLNATGTYTASGPDTWYAFVPDLTGRYSVSTCNVNTCNTVIWGYDRCDGVVNEQSQQEAVFYSDDACGSQASVETYMIAGKTYYLRIGDSGVSCEGLAIDFELSYLGPVVGCTDLASCNYNPLATVSDGSCIYPGNPGCPDGPDLIVLENVISSSLQVQNYTNNNQCYINEGCLKGYGIRQILRFTTHIQNIGNQDYFIGQPPSDPNAQSDQWEWDECHNHWHYEGYAEYLVFDEAGNSLPVGFKNGFCVIDLECSGGGSASYSCGNQGISHGCGDIYTSSLACQWVDLTNVPDGNYSLVVRVNWDRSPDALGRNEITYDNNWAQICFNLSRNANGNASVTEIANCPPQRDCLGELQGSAKIDCEGNCNGGRLAGDLDINDLYDINDVQGYFQGILDDNLPNTICNDISGDGTINMLEPALLLNCILDAGLHPDSRNPKCNFPYLTVNNPGQTATFTIGNTDYVNQYFDIYLQNPTASLLAFNLQMSGVTISGLQNLISDPGFSMNLGYDATGEIAGLSLIESATPRYSTAQAFVRVYYSAIDNEACLDAVMSVVNSKLELINGAIGTGNCTGNTVPSYCSVQGNNTSYEWINRVKLSNLDYTSGANGGYADFTGQIANVTAGPYAIQLYQGSNSSGPYSEHWKVWIDFNADGDFTDAGENVLTKTSTTTVNQNIVIPTGTGTINTRMRVAMRWNSDPSSCSNFDYGEVEDYSIRITDVQNQTITFTPIPDKITTDQPFAIAATASSGLPVSFSLISGPAVVVGNTVSLTGAIGTVTIRASQPGNPSYNPAPDVTQSFAVTTPPLQNQTINFPALSDHITTDTPFPIAATASSGLSVSFAIVSGPATISGNTISLSGQPGIVTVRASQPGDAQYHPAPEVLQSFNVMNPALQDQSITFAALADRLSTDLPFAITASASSGLPVSFSVLSGPVTLSGNTVTLSGLEGVVVIRASQTGNAQYNPAPEVDQSFTVTNPVSQNQTISFGPLSDRLITDPAFTITASASSGLPVSFNVLSGPATLIGNVVTLDGTAGTVVIRASQAGNAMYNAAPTVDQSFQVVEDSTPGEYCQSAGTQPWVEWIDRVTFGTIDNNSFKDLYGDYTNLSTEVDRGNSYPIGLNPGLSWSGYETDLFWRVWIDFNGDGDFLDSGELVLEANNGKNPVNENISIAASANLGATRMRVSMQKDAYAGPCEIFNYGEVEDYTVVIGDGTGGPVCDNLTDGGTIIGDETGCDGYDAQLIGSPTLPSGGSGAITYKWESSTSSATGPWSNTGSTGITFDPPTISQSTWYRRLARRENCTTYAGISNVVLKAVDNCGNPGEYCDAKGNQPWWEWIGEVIFGNIQNSSFKDLYGDYTSQSTDVEQGGIYPITFNPGLSWPGYETDLFWRVWIDFNQDGDFIDLGEMVLEVNNGRDPIAANIDIPLSANLGTTRMRIAMQRDQFAGACENFNYGEVEDYTVNILPLPTPPNRHQATLALSVQKEGQGSLLEWATNTELYNAYFIVERSVNGGDFSELMRVPSRSDQAGVYHYSRRDDNPLEGTLTYRIIAQFHDGAELYSLPQSLVFDNLGGALLLFPNPANASFTVKVKNQITAAAVIQIHNILGQLVEERQVTVLNRSGEFFHLESYQNGVYFVSVKMEGRKRLTGQLVVSRVY